MESLKRTKKIVTIAMCGVKLITKRSSRELKDLFSLKKTLDRLSKANRVRWYRDASKRDKDDG